MANDNSKQVPVPGLEGEQLLPADVHDITEEGSDMTRDIFFAILKETQDGPPRPKSLPDQSEILHEDIGALRRRRSYRSCYLCWCLHGCCTGCRQGV
jgi:hypothetical protein